MILACQNINKAFGTNVILKDASFHIEEKEKAAIVGINGAGKSTLLKIIMKQIPADSGEVILAKDRTIGYLAQHEAVSSGNTIYEELLEVKQDIFELERHIRTLELQMKSRLLFRPAYLFHFLRSDNLLSHSMHLQLLPVPDSFLLSQATAYAASQPSHTFQSRPVFASLTNPPFYFP